VSLPGDDLFNFVDILFLCTLRTRDQERRKSRPGACGLAISQDQPDGVRKDPSFPPLLSRLSSPFGNGGLIPIHRMGVKKVQCFLFSEPDLARGSHTVLFFLRWN
jgi:hypothetical protein